MSDRAWRFLSAVLMAALMVRPARAGSDLRDPPEGLINEGWYALLMSGQKSGHMHGTLRREGQRILSATEMTLAIKRGPAVVEIRVETRTEERLDGTPLKSVSVMNLASQMNLTHTTEFDGTKAKVTTEQFGRPTVSEYELSAKPLLAWGSLVEQQRRGFAPGTRYTLAAYEPAIKPDDVLLTRVEVVGPETIDLLGRQTQATKLKTAIEGLPMDQVSWVDEDGEMLRMTTFMVMMQVELVRCDKTFALQDKDPPEMFAQSMVPVGRSLDRAGLKRLRLRLSVPQGQLPDLPETQMQNVRRLDPRTVELTIIRIDHKKLKGASPVEPVGEAAECLRSNAYMDLNDPELTRMAAAAVKGADGLYDRLDRLRNYVSREITDKSLDVGLATASEVARGREGDCTEHGVLLAALGRANGIPARVVTGLAYVPEFLGSAHVFGYHMWTQYYVDGGWVDVDAAFRQTEVDPTHIALSVMSLNDQSFFDSAFSILPLMGRLKIEVLEAE